MDAPSADIAYAKVNLALHVRRRRNDGYHDIETLFAFVDDGDRLAIGSARDLSLQIAGPFSDDLCAGADNLVVRAAAHLRERAGITAGAAFHLEKLLPVASGLGGGSADAAAALRLAAGLWGITENDPLLATVAAEIGADVPACLFSQTCYGTGVGDVLTSTDTLALTGTPILLVNPLVECPTGPVFAAWDGVDRGALEPADWRRGRNDLTTPARQLCPEIDEVLTVLRAQLPIVSRMSGSGATCFALFPDVRARDAAADRIASSHPDWWVMTGSLR